MDLSREGEQRKEFCNILFELAEDQQILQDECTKNKIYNRLENLYHPKSQQNKYRHFYSDIFTVLTEIKQNPKYGNIEYLGQNLGEIRASYKAINYDSNGRLIDIGDNIQKLYDHVSLDIARMNYSDAGDWKISGKEAINDIQAQINNVKSELKQATESQKSIEDDLAKQQREYISILGIFAAVVLAFTGGIAFSTSVLENINSVSIYRIVVIALIIGLVLINILFGLFNYISKLVNKNNESKIKPLFISNVVIISLILCCVVTWYFGVVESRNNRIENKDPTPSSMQDK